MRGYNCTYKVTKKDSPKYLFILNNAKKKMLNFLPTADCHLVLLDCWNYKFLYNTSYPGWVLQNKSQKVYSSDAAKNK